MKQTALIVPLEEQFEVVHTLLQQHMQQQPNYKVNPMTTCSSSRFIWLNPGAQQQPNYKVNHIRTCSSRFIRLNPAAQLQHPNYKVNPTSTCSSSRATR